VIIEEPDIFARTMREELPIFMTVNNRAISTRINSLGLAAVKLLDAFFPDKYNDYADVFSEEEAGTLLNTSQITHIIQLVDGKEPPHRPLYNLSANKLSVLQKYLEDSQAKSWI
jgi:hypothetical protein